MDRQEDYQQVVIIRPGFFSAMIAGIISMFLNQPIIYIITTPFTKSRLGSLWIKLTRAVPLSFEHCVEPDSGYFYGDRNQTATAVTNWLCADPGFQRFVFLYIDLTDARGKLETVVRAYVDQECLVLTHLLGYLSGISAIKSTLLVGPVTVIQRQYLTESGFSVRLLRPPAVLMAVFTVTKFASHRIASWWRTSRKKLQLSGRTDTLQPKQLPGQLAAENASDALVIFFPHQTVSYGGLFYKDQFYNTAKSSPFHPSRILHVEIEPIKQSSITSPLVDYYSVNGIRYCFLPRASTIDKSRLIMKKIRPLLSEITLYSLLKTRSRTLNLIQLKAWWQYTKYRHALHVFPNARLALIGYEILFPKLLYLALESHGIRTVASQERFHASVFFNNWNFFLDTYFCSSAAIGKFLKRSRYRKIANTVATGFVRTDLLYDFRNSLKRQDVLPAASNFEKLVVLYDSPVFPDYDTARLMYVANWTCNHAYYRDVMRLAKLFPAALFVIRCKDIFWIEDKEFQATVRQLDQTPNIVLSREFAQHAMQYKLAAVADLVISKYSSIGDECLSVGIPMIFHDYTVLQSSSAYRTFNYHGLPIFAHDFETLLDKTRTTLEYGHYLGDNQRMAAAKLLNDRLADGCARERIHEALNNLYNETVYP